MKTNKLTIEEQFLTLEQAKELKEIGIDFSGANYCFRNVDFNKNPSWKYIKDKGEDDIHIFIDLYKFRKDSDILCIKTLSVAEMIEMLPEYTSIEHYTGKWHISDNHNSLYPHFERNVLLRDALFEMIKLLKQNKFI